MGTNVDQVKSNQQDTGKQMQQGDAAAAGSSSEQQQQSQAQGRSDQVGAEVKKDDKDHSQTEPSPISK